MLIKVRLHSKHTISQRSKHSVFTAILIKEKITTASINICKFIQINIVLILYKNNINIVIKNANNKIVV